MVAYIYRAALICSDCAKSEIGFNERNNLADSGDSDTYPQGPYSNGGGEADMPQHCDKCGVFLENPLTSEGYDYIKQQWEKVSPDTEWRNYYSLDEAY